MFYLNNKYRFKSFLHDYNYLLFAQGGKFASMILGSSESLKYLFAGDTDQTIGGILYFISMIRGDVGTNNTLKVLDVSRIIPDTDTYQYNPEILALNMGLMLKVNIEVFLPYL